VKQPAPLAWMSRPEGGGRVALWFVRTLALRIGRTPARLVLAPVAAYFVLRRGPERRASRRFLARALGRPATLRDVWRHMFTFAVVTLDRIFLLTEEFRRFELRTHGLDEVFETVDFSRGVLFIGAHVGSFDALRVLALQKPGLKVHPVIDLKQNPTVSRLLNALNPAIAGSIINARQDGVATALAIREALEQRAVVTLLADRARPGNDLATVDLLGLPAALPTAPWLLAIALKVPVVLCFGLYRGGRCYELHFEKFADSLVAPRPARAAVVIQVVQRFADRLSHYARLAPYNWFNFYDLWI
jgi:predicted LPLAT superfamily acyltransferase